MMRRISYCVACAAVVAAFVTALGAGRVRAAGDDNRSAAQEKEQKLIEVLQSDAPLATKAIT